MQIMKSTSIKSLFCSLNDKEKIGAKAYRMHFLCKNTGERQPKAGKSGFKLILKSQTVKSRTVEFFMLT